MSRAKKTVMGVKINLDRISDYEELRITEIKDLEEKFGVKAGEEYVIRIQKRIHKEGESQRERD